MIIEAETTQEQVGPNEHHMTVHVPQLPEPNPTPALRFVGDVSKLFDAIAKARVTFGEVKKARDGQIGNQKFKYSPLGMLTDASMGPLSGAGVSVMQFPTASPINGMERLTTVVAGHGARIECWVDYKPDANIQLYGKQQTYLRRYAYNAIFVLDGVPDQDEKGDTAKPEDRTVSDGQNATISGMFNKLGFDKSADARMEYAAKVIGKPVDDFMYLDAQALIKHLGAQIDAKNGQGK